MNHQGILLGIAPMSVTEYPARPVLERLVRVLAHRQEPMLSDSKKPRGAVAILMRNEADDSWLLMIRRRENPKDPWSGQMAFPGGHSDPMDPTLYDTARRETIEEVGIDLSEHQFVGCLPNVQTKNVPMIVTPFVFLELRKIDPTTSREAADIVWVPISFLANHKNISSATLSIRDANVLGGSYDYSGHVIWGISFRIIQEIISILTNPNRRHET